MKLVVAVIACGFLSGCGIFNSMHDRSAFIAAKNAYTTCLGQHPSDVSACEGLRRAYEVNLQVYESD